MAFTVTSRGTKEQNSATSSVIPSFTPTANSLLLLSFYTTSIGVDPTSITGHGTWVKIGSHTTIGSASLVVYGCIVGASPSASAVTIDYSYTTFTESGIVEVDGADTSGTVATAIVQDAGGLAQYNAGGGPYSLAETLNAFSSPTNLSLILAATPNNSDISAETGYTEHYKTTTAYVVLAASKTGEDLNPTIEATIDYTHMGLKAFEIKEAAAPSGTTINVDIPADIDLEWGTTHELAVTHDGGTTTLSGVTLSAPTGWETVSFATIPDTGTTESFYEYSQSDVTVGNFTAQVGDTLAFTSATGLTVDGSSIPVVDPAATVSGSYKWWDASLSTWTPVSSYTITNLGVFGGGDTTVMIQEMISDMISEMVN